MSEVHANTTLSVAARLLLYTGSPATVLLTFLADRRAGLLAPLAFVPAVLFYRRWHNLNTHDSSRRGSLETMLWTFAATSTIGITLVGLAQLGIIKTALNLLFGIDTEARKDFVQESFRSTIAGLSPEQLAHRAALSRTWQNWVYNAVFTFLAAGLVEEGLKYLPIAYAKYRGTPKDRKSAYLDYAMAGALGFGLTENIGFIYAACTASAEAPLSLALTVAERLVLGTAAHGLTSALMAVRAVQRDFYGAASLGVIGVLGPSILLHGAWDFMALSFSALEGNVGWIHPKKTGNTVAMLGVAAGFTGLVGWWVRREWKVIEKADKAE